MQTKTDVIADVKQSNVRGRVLTNELILLLRKCSELVPEFAECFNDFKHDQDAFANFARLVSKEIRDIRLLFADILTLKNQISAVAGTAAKTLDVGRFKTKVERLDEVIGGFKARQNDVFQKYLEEERSIGYELEVMERHIYQLETVAAASNAAAASAPPRAFERDVTKDLPPQVAEFETFLITNGGHNGDWPEYEHQTFVRVCSKHKAQRGFVDELESLLPTKTRAEIDAHNVWYTQYVQLLQRKREAIEQWKYVRKDRREQLASEAVKQESAEVAALEQQRQEAAEREQKRREQAAQRVSAWRVQKELQRAAEDERAAKTAEERRVAEQRRREELADLRDEVRRYRSERCERRQFERLEEELRAQEAAERRRQVSAKDVHRIEQRNAQMLNEKVSRRQQLVTEAQLKVERDQRLREQALSRLQVERDPQRLLQPTSGWRHRTEAGRDADGGQARPVAIGLVPHRAVPSWRQGVP